MADKMPALFVGHGSPMNAIEENAYTRTWERIAGDFPKPKAILAVSAHWYTHGSRIMDESQPQMVYDMYGFPHELYQVRYNAPGAPVLSRKTRDLISRDVAVDNSWGFDHGAWSVLCKMYPQADIPLYQLSVDAYAPPEEHFRMGQEIGILRNEGVLILGSGNIVHNLLRLDWNREEGFDWADEFDLYVKNSILSRQFQNVAEYKAAGNSARAAVPTPDHFYPLLYVLGAARPDDKVYVFNESRIMGSVSMTGYLFK